MASILRTKLKWNGFAGAPGYTNLFFKPSDDQQPDQADAQAAANFTNDFGAYVRTYLPIEASMQVQSDVEELWDTTGALQNIFTVNAMPVLQGQAASAPYSAASGAVVTWRTGGVRNGRRVRGRTFLVPLANSAYQSDGTIASAVLTAWNTNFTTLMNTASSVRLGVYARPTVQGASDGSWFAATGFTIPDKVAVLRSRRD